MVRRQLVASRQAARYEIEAGRVVVDGAPAAKPARLVAPGEDIRLLGPPPRYVSRAGHKLEAGLDGLGITVDGWRCVDAGSSTGGFTDCLLQRGARSVVAIDVGTHQLHEKLRADERVTVMEQTDIRTVTPVSLGGPADLVVADLSFISLRLVLPALLALSRPGAPTVVLVKPQFEAGRSEASRGRGVIRDPTVWRRVLDEVVDYAADLGVGLRGIVVSPITGGSGNVEFLVGLQPGASTLEPVGELLHRTVTGAEARGR
jgi:23S rRNA (cytidine1920-2'-O)/16S rRNA (cytidine1409-2'-O)-methyltransferase